MNHIIDALDTGPKDTWLIVGKGPSFNPDIVYKTDSKILCINDTSNLILADLCLFNDLSVIERFTPFAIETTKLFACPYSISNRNDPKETAVPFWIRTSETWTKIKDKLVFFDANFSVQRKWHNHPRLHAHCSTYESAIWLLAYKGVKKVYTNGIDHSQGYHKDFIGNANDANYGAVKHYAQVPIEFYGMKVEAL